MRIFLTDKMNYKEQFSSRKKIISDGRSEIQEGMKSNKSGQYQAESSKH